MAISDRLRWGGVAVAASMLAACGQTMDIPQHLKAPSPPNAVRDVVRLINKERTARNLKPLKPKRRLAAAAQFHAEYMAKNDCYEHTCPNGPGMMTRLKKAGYVTFRASENIYASPRTPEQVVRGWMNSAGHRANILDPKVREIGIGHYYLRNDGGRVRYHHYWVANFGAGRPLPRVYEAERGQRR